jgi:hypothetical protein
VAVCGLVVDGTGEPAIVVAPATEVRHGWPSRLAAVGSGFVAV